MHLTGLDLFFWVASLLGHITLLFVLWRKHRVRQFPIFTGLITFYVLRTLALFFVFRYGSHHAYFNTYWSLAIGDVGLQLMVLYEVASHIFCPTGRWARDVRGSFMWMLGASVAFAVCLTWLCAPATRTMKQTVVIRGNLFSSILMSELFVGMIVLSVTTGLPWRTHVARIAQGLGVNAIAGILIEAMQSYFGVVQGTELYQVLSQVQIGIYLLCLTYWIVTLRRNAPQSCALPDQLHRQLLHLNERAAIALSYLRPGRRA